MNVIQYFAMLQVITCFCWATFTTRQIFLYTSQEALFFFPPISLLRNWPGKSETEPVSEKAFTNAIKNDCMTGNSVYSVTVEMEIQFKLSQLLPLTPADQVSLKFLLIFSGDEGTVLKFFSFLLLRSIVLFPLSASRNGECRAMHHNLYVTKLLLFHVPYFSIPKTPQ